MNVIYFTAGTHLMDGEIRRQSLRIAEVLGALQGAQRQQGGWDVMNAMILEEEFARASEEQHRELIKHVQWGLFERFSKSHTVYTEMIHRRDFPSAAAVAKHFKWLMRSGEHLTIFVVGPGLDEVPSLLADHRADFIEVVENDPSLHWFWQSLQKAANA